MRKLRRAAFVAGLAVPAMIAPAAAVPQAPGTARAWFLHESDLSRGDVAGAAPMIYANGVPVGQLPPGTIFYRDFPAGTWRFTVDPYGLPTDQSATLQLAPGTETYLHVQWASSWEFGTPPAGWSSAPNTFVITPLSPQLAQAYLPSLAYIGGR
jgi:hypothetical protein